MSNVNSKDTLPMKLRNKLLLVLGMALNLQVFIAIRSAKD